MSRSISRVGFWWLVRSLLLRLAPAGSAGSGQPRGQCTDAHDCALNGRCVRGKCVCEPAWSASADCTLLAFVPGRRAAGYRQLSPLVSTNATSWGGGGFYDAASGLWLLWVSEMANGCGMATWTTNSHTIRASSADPLGLYQREAVQFPVWTHESVITRGPNGEWVAFMSYNVPQTRHICKGCEAGMTNKSCKEPRLLHRNPAFGRRNIYIDGGSAGPAQNKPRVGGSSDRSDWDPTYMSWAPATSARNASEWSKPVLIGQAIPQIDTNFAAVIDSDGRLFGMWRDHHRDASGSKAKSTIHLVTATNWKDNSSYVFEHDDLLFSGKKYPGGVEDPFMVRSSRFLIAHLSHLLLGSQYKDAHGNYHALFHLLYNGRKADPDCGAGHFLGGHAYSPAGDGRNWNFTGTAFDGNFSYLDSGPTKVCNGDRPKLLFDKDGVTPLALTSAAGLPPANISMAVLDQDQAFTLLRPLRT
eukprot:SAG31_NODE_2724_length_5187_cov_2.096895_5_plen_472_part_00